MELYGAIRKEGGSLLLFSRLGQPAAALLFLLVTLGAVARQERSAPRSFGPAASRREGVASRASTSDSVLEQRPGRPPSSIAAKAPRRVLTSKPETEPAGAVARSSRRRLYGTPTAAEQLFKDLHSAYRLEGAEALPRFEKVLRDTTADPAARGFVVRFLVERWRRIPGARLLLREYAVNAPPSDPLRKSCLLGLLPESSNEELTAIQGAIFSSSEDELPALALALEKNGSALAKSLVGTVAVSRSSVRQILEEYQRNQVEASLAFSQEGE